MKSFVLFFATILILCPSALAHDGKGPQIDKHGNVIFHEELTHNIAPTMPPWAKESGYCCVMLDILKTGRVENTEVIYCSSPVFWDITERTAPKITYHPKTINGNATSSKDVLEHFSFRLANQHGEIMKNADGYPEVDEKGNHSAEHYCRQYVS